MACPICGARTSGLCQRCQMERRLERERKERLEADGRATGWDRTEAGDDD